MGLFHRHKLSITSFAGNFRRRIFNHKGELVEFVMRGVLVFEKCASERCLHEYTYIDFGTSEERVNRQYALHVLLPELQKSRTAGDTPVNLHDENYPPYRPMVEAAFENANSPSPVDGASGKTGAPA